MLDIVEMNGWILKRAVKKPAIDVNITENKTQINKASIALPNAGIALRSIKLPKTVPVFGPLCIITVAMTMFIPVIRPMDRSVPVNKIRPATPRAKNIRGEACCIMFMTLLTVSSWVCLIIGVMMQRTMKTIMMTIYRPFFNKKSFRLKL
jgi:hypothetical protein